MNNKIKRFPMLPCLGFLVAVMLGVSASGASPQTLPNILWLTIEDTSSYEFGCYGNKQVKTPNVDALAAKGVLFTNASSTAPQCSPARSTIISGSYAKTYGTGFHRRTYPSSKERIFLPQVMKRAGYFCLNAGKTDYNTKPPDGLWDKGRDYGQTQKPFFAVFNHTSTHMKSVRGANLPPSDIDMSHLYHLPNLPEIRANYAKHLNAVEGGDKWVGKMLADLKKSGKEEDTIVFFYSDHGGCQPRGKGFPYETGFRVPLIVYVPPRWQHLSNDLVMGKKTARLVGFEDLAPTVISLAGVKPPSQMQGKAFMGKHGEASKIYQFGFRTNQGIHFDPIRTVSDGRYKYIRSYSPHKPLGMRQEYQWGMSANKAYDYANLKGELPPKYAAFFK